MPAKTANPPSSRLIICERSGRWAAWLRRLAGDGGRWMLETRGLSQLLREVGQHPASLCAIEATAANIVPVAEVISRLHRDFPASRVVALCDPQTIPCQWHLREAGAVHAIASPRQADPLIRLWRRHCREYPPREQTPMECFLARLPW